MVEVIALCHVVDVDRRRGWKAMVGRDEMEYEPFIRGHSSLQNLWEPCRDLCHLLLSFVHLGLIHQFVNRRKSAKRHFMLVLEDHLFGDVISAGL